MDWFRSGLVTPRNQVYETDHDIQRGLLAGVLFKKLDLTTYVFNPDESKPTMVVARSVHGAGSASNFLTTVSTWAGCNPTMRTMPLRSTTA